MIYSIICCIFVWGLAWSSYHVKAEALPVAPSFCNAIINCNVMKNEIWKDIKGYDGLYQVSNFGRVKSLHGKEKIIKPHIQNSGYLMLKLCINNNHKHKLIHRLVAETFINNENNKITVNHIDGNKLNNTVGNLEWMTRKENSIHASKNNLFNPYWSGKNGILNKSNKPIYRCDKYNGEILEEYYSIKYAASKLNCNPSGISSCLIKKTKSAYGFKWIYK